MEKKYYWYDKKIIKLSHFILLQTIEKQQKNIKINSFETHMNFFMFY